MPPGLTFHVALFEELDALTLYRLLKLRTDIFIAEQGDPYSDLDDRDFEPGAVHLWLADGDLPVAYLRILEEPDDRARIGPIVVAAAARGKGLGTALLTAALERVGPRACVLSAQERLADFYAAFGFSPVALEQVSGLIPHVSMVRPAAASDS